MKRIREKEKGITLVALIITIIILLILSGITIISLTSSGLFEKVKEAKLMHEKAQNKQNEILEDYENQINEYIDGSRDTISSMTKSELEDLIDKKVNSLQVELDKLKSDYQSMVSSGLVVFDANNIIQDKITTNADTEITYTATQNCAIQYNYYFKLADGGTGICSVDGVKIAPVYTTGGSGYFSCNGIIYLKAGSVFKMKSIKYNGQYTVYGLK